jgi:hypothetical protein
MGTRAHNGKQTRRIRSRHSPLHWVQPRTHGAEIVERFGRLLCRISGRDGGVSVSRVPAPKAWAFTENETQDALKRVLEILTDDCEERPHDTRNRFTDYVPFEPISSRI